MTTDPAKTATNRQVQLLVFCLENRQYGLRLGQVQRVVRAVDVTPLPDAPEVVMGIIDVHGQIIPVLNTRKRFGFPLRDIGVDDQFIIANASNRTVALAVDRVREIVEHPEQEIVPASEIAPHLEQIEGVIELDDGLVLIHDLARFLSIREEHALQQALTGHAGNGR